MFRNCLLPRGIRASVLFNARRPFVSDSFAVLLFSHGAPALAGHYDVTYAGGSVSATSPQGNTGSPYGIQQDGSWGGSTYIGASGVN